MFPYIETENGFQTLIENKSYPVEASHEHYDELLGAADAGDKEAFLKLYSKATVINKVFDGTKVVVQDGVVYFEDEAMHNVVTDKIVSCSEKGLNPQPMIKFLENLMSNPSARAVNELYGFLAHSKLPITEDGCFLAYKTVRSDFKDKYSQTIDNSVGQIVEIRRNLVNDDKEQTCSHGLHVGALEYAGPGGWYNNAGDVVLIVKINPADAVSVPADHNAQKLRVCKYEVIGLYESLPDDYYPQATPEPEPSEDSVGEDEDEVCAACGEIFCNTCYNCSECYCDGECEEDEYDDSWS